MSTGRMALPKYVKPINPKHPPPAAPIDYDTLDLGIMDVVRLLRAHGFDTTDSGDGVSKVGQMDCALPYPHVFIVTRPSMLIHECQRLRDLLSNHGVVVNEIGPNEAPFVQGTFDAGNGSSLIELGHVTDAMLLQAQSDPTRTDDTAKQSKRTDQSI